MNSLQAFALVSVVLWLKVFVTICVQGAVRLRSKRFNHVEDAVAFGGEANATDHPVAIQAQHAIRNDVENLPFFAMVLLAFALVDGPPQFILIYGGLYVALRTLHTVAFVRPVQPFRNRVYSLALTVHVAVAGHLVWLVVPHSG